MLSKFFFVLFLLLFKSFASFGQTKNQPDTPRIEILDFPDSDAEFKGGEPALINYIQENFHPDTGCAGTIMVSTIIDKDGKATNPKIVKGISKCCNTEAIRVVKEMPKWKPAMLNGQPVRYKIIIPFTVNIGN